MRALTVPIAMIPRNVKTGKLGPTTLYRAGLETLPAGFADWACHFFAGKPPASAIEARWRVSRTTAHRWLGIWRRATPTEFRSHAVRAAMQSQLFAEAAQALEQMAKERTTCE